MSATNTVTPQAVNAGDQTQAKDPGLVPQQAGTAGSADQSQNLTKEAAREAIRKLKIKHADGKEEEVAEDEVLKVYRERKGHQSAANKELQEGKAAKKQAEEFISMMKDKQKLFDAIQKLGHDPRKLAEEYLSSQLEEELLDPREKELRNAQRKLKEYQDLEKRQRDEADRRRDEELKAKYSKDYTEQFVEALKSTNLPPTKAAVGEMAKYISRAAKMNFKMTPIEAAKLVKEDIELAHKNLYGEADAEALVRILGDGALQKLRAYDTAKLKDPNSILKTPQGQENIQSRVKSSSKPMTHKEWRDFNRK